MRFIYSIPLLLCFVVLSANAAGKSAFINPAIILEQAPQARAASKALENEFKQLEADLRSRAIKIQEMEKNYQKDSAIMSAAQKKKIEGEIIQKKRQFQFDQQSVKEDLQLRRKQLIQEMQKTISDVIRSYGEKNGYDFIFTEGVAYASDSVNITEEILKELAK
jgi:outer membrane protein